MTEAVLIRPAAAPDVTADGIADLWEFSRLAADAAKDAFRGALAEVAGRCRRRRVVVLVPGAEVSLHSVPTPARNASEIRMAVPYALEDQLAGKIESLHFAIGPKSMDGSVPVAVMAHATLRAYVQQLEAAGIVPAAFIPEPLALPWREGTRSVLIDPHRAVVRTAATRGYTVERSLLPQVIRRAGEPRIPTRLWCNPETVDTALLGELSAAGEDPVDQRPLPAVPVALFAEGLHALPCRLDLLQGEHRVPSDGDFRHWRPALTLLALALCVHLGWSLWDLVTLRRGNGALAQRAEELFRATFPEVQRIVDIEAQAEQQLAALRAGSTHNDFLALYARAGAVLQNFSGVRVEGYAYGKDELELRLTAQDDAGFAQVQERIAQVGGLQGQLLEVQSGATGSSARLVVKPTGMSGP